MPRLNDRLERLEHGSGDDADAGPSLIILTALGREFDEVSAIRLPDGTALDRRDGESAADFRERASALAAAAGGMPVKLAAAVYRDEVDREAC